MLYIFVVFEGDLKLSQSQIGRRSPVIAFNVPRVKLKSSVGVLQGIAVKLRLDVSKCAIAVV